MKSFKILIIVAFAMLILVPGVQALSYDLVVVREDLPADLMVAQVYTQKEGIPLIAISERGIDSSLSTELSSYNAQGYKNALIIGGEDVVSTGVENSLSNLGYDVERLWDWDRYGTSARVAISLWEHADTVIVAQGDTEGRLISAARVAIDYKSPLLLTKTESVPIQTKQAINELGTGRIILIGDVSDEVKDELSKMAGLEQPSMSYIELAGGETSGSGLFIIGIIIGALMIFLLSSLWGAGFLSARAEIPYSILNENEQRVVDIILEKKGAMKQQDLPKLINFSRPKVSRIVSELVSREIVFKEKKGKTYVLKLGKKVRKS